VNSWVLGRVSFQNHLLQVFAGWWIPEFFAEFPNPPLVASVAEWMPTLPGCVKLWIFYAAKVASIHLSIARCRNVDDNY
jgi:hypothetical protein